MLPKDFPSGCSPLDFWKRCHYDPLNYAWGSVVKGSDFPIDHKCLIESISTLPQADDAVKVSASADALFEEAMANKRGTIPRNAYVELAFGPFTHFEVTELDFNVLVICRCADDTFLQVSVEPRKNHCSFKMPGDDEDGISPDFKERINAGVKLLFAAIVRDFWVIENREAVFDHRIQRTGSGTTRDDDSPRVVYIPRIRYCNQTNADHCAEQLNHTERRSHFVRAHVRRSAVASKHQLVLAERYGIEVPTGYTFVRPHERGKSPRDVIYRSRSALQCLYVASQGTESSRPAQWFQFERDVHALMERLGFDVQHISAARRGDGGVDVFATKGDDLELVNWVIQCKCWSARRKVYPSSVRELIGVLTDYPGGTRGMIVTTSAFSTGAVELAASHNIRLIDGEEFIRHVQSNG